MGEQSRPEDVYRSLLPYVGQPTKDWARRWATVIGEVERRSGTMTLESAVASVRDDLEARRL